LKLIIINLTFEVMKNSFPSFAPVIFQMLKSHMWLLFLNWVVQRQNLPAITQSSLGLHHSKIFPKQKKTFYLLSIKHRILQLLMIISKSSFYFLSLLKKLIPPYLDTISVLPVSQ
jgi:hypothetical protein